MSDGRILRGRVIGRGRAPVIHEENMATNAGFSTDMVQGDETGWMTPDQSEALNSQVLDKTADEDNSTDNPAPIAEEGEEDDNYAAADAENVDGDDEDEGETRRGREKTPEEARLARARRDKRRLTRELDAAKAQNAALEDRVNRIEQATIATQMRELENEVGALNSALENARTLKREARRAGDVDEEDRIERAVDVLVERKAQAAARLERAQQEVQQRVQPQRPQQRVVPRLAQDWAAKHQNLVSDPSAFPVVRALSSTLENEGYDIDDPDHYRELTERLRRALPEKFPKSQRPPVAAGGNGSSPRAQSQPRDKLKGVNDANLRAYRGTQTFKDNVKYLVKSGVKPEVAERQELQEYAKAFRSFNQ